MPRLLGFLVAAGVTGCAVRGDPATLETPVAEGTWRP